MSKIYDLTPEQKREELINKGVSAEEVDVLLKGYTEGYRKSLTESQDVLKTADALKYINSRLEEEGLVDKTKDKLTITNLRDLTIKPDEEGKLRGRILPINPHAAKKIGFHFKKKELDMYLEREIKVRKSNKDELFEENERLKERVLELEKQLKANTQGTKEKVIKTKSEKSAIEIALEKASLSSDKQELTYFYKRGNHSVLFGDDGEILKIDKTSGTGKGDVTEKTSKEEKEAITRAWKKLAESN